MTILGRSSRLKASTSTCLLSRVESGTGPSIVERTLADSKLGPNIGLRVPSFLGVSRIVAETELVVVVPRSLGEALAA